eukprot:5854737-Pleurochrysis_carterae.AAC.1
MDGFPVTGFSPVHFCVYNCSLSPKFVTQSEAELRYLAITRLLETTEATNATYIEGKFAEDVNKSIAGEALSSSDGAENSPLYMSVTIAAAALLARLGACADVSRLRRVSAFVTRTNL